MYKALQYAALLGNVMFALWILYNGMNEGWRATPMQLASYLVLISLLTLNSILIYRKK